MDITDRLTELEVKLAFQDDLLDTLNRTVTRQQQQIDLLQQQLRLLYQQWRNQEAGQDLSSHGRYEPPPHY